MQAQNQKYQEHLRDLETRIDTIQALQNSRVGPVQLMSALGNVVNKTSDVFLYTLTPAPVGDGFLLKGQSSTVSSMANSPRLPEEFGHFSGSSIGPVLSG